MSDIKEFAARFEKSASVLFTYYRQGRLFIEHFNKSWDKYNAVDARHLDQMNAIIKDVQNVSRTLSKISNTAKESHIQKVLASTSATSKVVQTFVTRCEIFWRSKGRKVKRGALRYLGIDEALIAENIPSDQDDSDSDNDNQGHPDMSDDSNDEDQDQQQSSSSSSEEEQDREDADADSSSDSD
jgi:hypothetical protein